MRGALSARDRKASSAPVALTASPAPWRHSGLVGRDELDVAGGKPLASLARQPDGATVGRAEHHVGRHEAATMGRDLGAREPTRTLSR
jgi:hypothetical protein